MKKKELKMNPKKARWPMASLQLNVIVLFALWASGCCNHSCTESPIAVAGSNLAETNVTDCQLLLTEEEVKLLDIARQRNMYPASSRSRLSAHAVRDGFHASTRHEAMREFNRAWRFDPENPMAYWGAAIVRGCEALKYSEDRSVSGECWRDCVTLFEKGASLSKALAPIQQCEFQVDMAVSYRNYAQFLQKESGDKANEFLEKAEVILMKYRNCNAFQSEQNRIINIRVLWELKKLYSIWDKRSEEEKCDEEFKQITSAQERRMFLNSLKNARWLE